MTARNVKIISDNSKYGVPPSLWDQDFDQKDSKEAEESVTWTRRRVEDLLVIEPNEALIEVSKHEETFKDLLELSDPPIQLIFLITKLLIHIAKSSMIDTLILLFRVLMDSKMMKEHLIKHINVDSIRDLLELFTCIMVIYLPGVSHSEATRSRGASVALRCVGKVLE